MERMMGVEPIPETTNPLILLAFLMRYAIWYA
jgi:hypothetical protein